MSEISDGSDSDEGLGGGTGVDGTAESDSTAEVSGTTESSSSAESMDTYETGTGTGINSFAETGVSREVGGSEITINPTETTRGMNQILETPETLEQAQSSIENFHRQSIAQILDMNGKYINEADRERILNGADNVKAVEYNPHSRSDGRFFTWDGKSNIEVAAINKEQMERTTKHETNHFASKNREIIVPMPDRGGHMVYETVGMRHSSWFHNDKTGENSGFETTGRGLNEGMTTMFTNEQLAAISEEKGMAAERAQIYAHATEVCKQFQETMGTDALKEAYYGGNTMALQEKMDVMGGKGTFEQFQRSMDKTISRDYAERVEGMREAQEILARLDEIKNGGDAV